MLKAKGCLTPGDQSTDSPEDKQKDFKDSPEDKQQDYLEDKHQDSPKDRQKDSPEDLQQDSPEDLQKESPEDRWCPQTTSWRTHCVASDLANKLGTVLIPPVVGK